MDNLKKIFVSVIICTYNRIELIEIALASLIAQTLSSDMYEIIVVDNASTQPVKKRIESFIQKNASKNIRYVYESRQGLSYARNTGYKEARGEYIAYFDDDAKAQDDWLAKTTETIDKYAPDLLGGPIYPFYRTKRPKWFLDEYEMMSYGNQPYWIKRGYLWGSNMVIRKEILLQLNGFDTRLGRKGRVKYDVNHGEDIDFVCRAKEQKTDLKIYYNPEIVVYHLVAPTKMVMFYFLKRAAADGWCPPRNWEEEYKTYSKAQCLIGLIKAFLCLTVDVIFGIFFYSRRKYPFYQNYVIDVIFWEMRRFLKLTYILCKGLE